MRARIIIAIAVLQGLVLAYMAGEREWVLRTGRIIYLRSAPRDPRDVMRGDYVRVNYEISRVPRELCLSNLALTNVTVPPDTKVYALLKTNETGVAELVSLSSARPSGGLFIRGRTEGSWGEDLQVRYGVEAFFVEQGKAEAFEESSDREGVRVPLEMSVAVSPGGLGVLKDYRKSPLGIGLQLDSREETNTHGRQRLLVAATVRLFNASSNDLAIVDLPGARSFTLVPDRQWGANPWHWSSANEPRPVPGPAAVIVLKPGQSHSTKVDFGNPVWSVWKQEAGKADKQGLIKLSELRGDWSARFRLEYRAPDRAAVASLPSASLIWYGHLASRAFSPAGSVD